MKVSCALSTHLALDQEGERYLALVTARGKESFFRRFLSKMGSRATLTLNSAPVKRMSGRQWSRQKTCTLPAMLTLSCTPHPISVEGPHTIPMYNGCTIALLRQLTKLCALTSHLLTEFCLSFIDPSWFSTAPIIIKGWALACLILLYHRIIASFSC
jgi:hypothetical protein